MIFVFIVIKNVKVFVFLFSFMFDDLIRLFFKKIYLNFDYEFIELLLI